MLYAQMEKFIRAKGVGMKVTVVNKRVVVVFLHASLHSINLHFLPHCPLRESFLLLAGGVSHAEGKDVYGKKVHSRAPTGSPQHHHHKQQQHRSNKQFNNVFCSFPASAASIACVHRRDVCIPFRAYRAFVCVHLWSVVFLSSFCHFHSAAWCTGRKYY